MAKKENKKSSKVFLIAAIVIAALAAVYISLPMLGNQTMPNFATIAFTTTIQSGGAAATTTVRAGATTTVVVDTGQFQPSAVTLEIKSWGFNPNAVTLLKGSTASWTNLDNVAHTVTGSGFDSGDIAAGKSWSHTFSTAGTFEYSCKYHPSMTAKVIITE